LKPFHSNDSLTTIAMRLYEHLLGEVKPVNGDDCEKVYDQFDCYVTTVTQPIVIVRDDSDGLSLRKLVIAVLTLLLVGCSALLFVMTIYQAEMHSSNPVEEILLRENYPREDFAYIDQFIDFMNE
uniref:SEA domain-containing protein n=1 Tax=Anisakis simplex TaxID=6269 RepID=A0A0M3J749_ANISI